MLRAWHLAVIQWVLLHLNGTEFQPTFFPIRLDIFKEEGLEPGSAAGGFGSNLWTICAVLKPFGEPSEIPRQMRAKKGARGGVPGQREPGWGRGQDQGIILTPQLIFLRHLGSL